MSTPSDWPVLVDASATLSGATQRALVATSTVVALWREFKRLVAEPVPVTPDAAAEATQRSQRGLQQLAGVTLPAKFKAAVIYDGTARDGHCDLMARDGKDAVSAYRRVSFDSSVAGLVNALNLATALKRHWSWGHGCYDRDAELIIDPARLASILTGQAHQATTDRTGWPPAGIRLTFVDGVHTVACLAARPGRGLFDVSVRVRDGQASSVTVTDVYVWGQGVFY